MKSRFHIAGILLLMIALLAACSSSKEEVKEEPPPPPEKAEPLPESKEATPVYKYTERYLVPGASIAEATDFSDPIEAIRVIQMRKGINQVLVISAFDKMKIDGKETPVETWLGIEMKSFDVGEYDIGDAFRVQFYRFVLADKGKRFDGRDFSGTIEIKKNTPETVAGFINISVQGETKGFDEASSEFSLSFSGSFGVDKVALENTQMGR